MTGRGRPLLAVEGVTVAFGGLVAVNGVSFTVAERGAVSIVGPNGAGKSTLLNAVSGLVRPRSGRIRLGPEQVELWTLPAHARAQLGIGRTFQNSRLFGDLPVIDQLACGGYASGSYGGIRALARLRGALARERATEMRAQELLAELGLGGVAYAAVDELPSAHRRLVVLGRALMTQPRLLLLDEIAAGLAQQEKDQLVNVLRTRQQRDELSLVVIEHDLQFVRALADDVVVLVDGELLASGRTDDVLAQDDVLAAYVGEQQP